MVPSVRLMLLLLAKNLREISHWKGLGLFIVAIVGLSLTTASVNVARYKASEQEYILRTEAGNRDLEIAGELNRLYDMAPPDIPPEPLAIMGRGVSLVVRETATNESTVVDSGFNAHPLEAVFKSFDLTSTVMIAMGLSAVLLGATLLPSEVEAGTLELLVTSGVSLRLFVLAQWWWTMSVCVTGALVFLATGTVLAAMERVRFDLSRFADLAITSLICALYIASMSSLGTAISSFARTRVAATVVATVLWVVLIIALPSTIAYIVWTGTRVADIDDQKEKIEELLVARRESQSNKEIDLIKKSDDPSVERCLRGTDYTLKYFRGLPDKDVEPFLLKLNKRSPQLLEIWNNEQSQIINIVEQFNQEYRAQAATMEAALDQRLARQEQMIEVATGLLPGVAYQHSIYALYGLSLSDLLRAELSSKEYKSRVISYIFDKARLIGGADPFNVKLDLSDRPRFVYRRRTLPQRLWAVAPYFAILVLWTGIPLLLALQIIGRRQPCAISTGRST
jgi:ABC-type transport system involved in multi-copper enzyme maturation permease subunit